jgi:hypothetical protein
MDTNSNTHFSLFHNEIEKFLSINKNQKYFLYEINQGNKSIYDIKNQNKDEENIKKKKKIKRPLNWKSWKPPLEERTPLAGILVGKIVWVGRAIKAVYLLNSFLLNPQQYKFNKDKIRHLLSICCECPYNEINPFPQEYLSNSLKVEEWIISIKKQRKQWHKELDEEIKRTQEIMKKLNIKSLSEIGIPPEIHIPDNSKNHKNLKESKKIQIGVEYIFHYIKNYHNNNNNLNNNQNNNNNNIIK